MANRQHSSRSRRWPFGVVRSTLFILALTLSSTLAQAQPVVILNTPAQGSVTSCASLLASWAILLPVPDRSVENAINDTYIGIWASNVGVDQTPLHGMPTNPRLVDALEKRQQIVPAPITINVTTQPIPLSGRTSESGDIYTWTPVRLPPNQYYVMYLQSLPGHRRALNISAKSDKFFVSEGASQACLAGIVQSLTVTTSSTAQPSSTPTSGANGDTTAGENDVTPAASKKNRTGAIVGGVLGGIGLFGLLLLLFLYCLKRRRTGQKQDIGDFLASRGVNPYRRSLTTIEQRASSYEPTRYGGILAAIGIHPVSPEKEFGQSPRQSRASGAFYARRSSYHRQDDNADGAAHADAGNRTSFSRFRHTDMTDMATILASDPAKETAGEKGAARRSKSSSITTFAQSMVGAVPYHPYNTSPHPDDEEAAVGYSGVGGFGRPASQKHRRHSSLPMSSRASEGYAMSSIDHHPFSGAATQSREDDDGHEPEVMAWTGPTHKRASTALAGGAGARWSSVGEHKSSSAGEHKSSSAGDHMQQSSAGDHMQSTAGDHMASSSGEHRSSEGGGSAEFGGGLSPDQGAPLTRKKSGAASHKTGSTKASVTRKKAPELPLPIDPSAEPTGPAPPPSAYFTSGPGPSTTTVNTGASAYVPSQRDRDRRSADLMAYQNGRQSSEVFGPGTSAPGPSSAFDAFAGAKDGPVHILVPDLPPAQTK